MFTLVQNYGIMELWFTMENYGAMEKNMVQWEKTMVQYWKLVYYTENYGTSICEGKKKVGYPKLWIFVIYNEKNFGNIPKQLMFLNKYMALELWFSKEKLLHYGKKTMILWKKLIRFHGKKLWYYTEKYGNLIHMRKTMVPWKILWCYSKL